jgi:hypothetical protein
MAVASELAIHAAAAAALSRLQDVAGQPQQMTDGTLRTPGVVDFFRMLNEQVRIQSLCIVSAAGI